MNDVGLCVLPEEQGGMASGHSSQGLTLPGNQQSVSSGRVNPFKVTKRLRRTNNQAIG
jgi:hypothetical protein